MNLSKKVSGKFKELFNEEPYLFRSPGRVNLIGEHTDYNMGFVLPAAIDKTVYMAIGPRKDNNCKIFAYDMNDFFESSVEQFEKSAKGWPNYLLGVVDQLKKGGYSFNGFNCVFGGNIPIGAGLSSSAALEAGLAFALNYIYKLGIDKLSLVKMSQKAENEFVGVKCGIMDQFINIFGKSDHVLRIDCRSLEHVYFPFNYSNISIVLIDTNVSHSLASSEYNQRRKECHDGVKTIGLDYPEITSLRDVSLGMLREYRSKMEAVIYKRCKYVVEENDRLLKACEALSVHDLKEFGALMYLTHEGLSKDYEVSCQELDYLVELLRDNPKVYGSRMMGGGFGGCTINLIENDAIDAVTAKVKEEYKRTFGIEAKLYVTKISGGTNKIEVEEDVTV
jgi:galactokinase